MAQGACRGHPCLHPCGARKYAFADAAPPARLERDGVTKLAAQVRAVPADQHRHSQPTSALKARISTINRRIVQSTSRRGRRAVSGWQAVGSLPRPWTPSLERGRPGRWSGATGTYTPPLFPGWAWPPPLPPPLINFCASRY